MANATPEFSRGMAVVYNILKDGKAHTRATLKAALAKQGIKKSIFGRCFRLGRILRAQGIGDIIIERHEDVNKSTAKMVTGAQAKKSIAEKNERYKGLGGTKTKSKNKSKTKAKAKKSAKKSAAVHKTSTKKTAAKKPAKKKVTTTGSEESAC